MSPTDTKRTSFYARGRSRFPRLHSVILETWSENGRGTQSLELRSTKQLHQRLFTLWARRQISASCILTLSSVY